MCLSDKWHRKSSPELVLKRKSESKPEPKKESPDSFLPKKSSRNGEKGKEEESPPQDIDPSGGFSPH
jgi:hypothetical protein